MCTTTTVASSTQTFEDKVRQYAALFDGTKKDFSEVEAIFDNLYHEDFVGETSNGEKLNKEGRKELDKQRFAAAAKITHVTYKRIDYNKALVEFYLFDLESEDKDIIIQTLVSIKDKKIIESNRVDRLTGIIAAYWLSDYHSLRRGYHSVRRGCQYMAADIFKGRSKGLLLN